MTNAIYETEHIASPRPCWVTRVKHGPYVGYHYIQEAADQLTAMLNERTKLRGALVQIEGNDRDWNARYAAKVASEALEP